MSELPEEIIKEIVFRLPVKSILKFRRVCHSWLSLIDSPFFIKTQLSYANTTPKIILSNPIDRSLYALDLTTLNSTVLELSYPPKTSNLPTIIKGSCKGIISSFHALYEWDVALQNPYTKSFQKLPFLDCKLPGSENDSGIPENIVYGIGYDHLTDDVKVVRNVQFLADSGNMFYSLVQVDSLKMNSWRKVDPFPYEMYEGFFVGGALHWVVKSSPGDRSHMIVAFDLAVEEYRLIQVPVYPSGDFELYVNVLRECLVACYCYLSVGCVDLWVMKEYGKVESWFNVLYVRIADIGAVIGFVRPLVYSECGKKVLLELDREMLAWYDVEAKSVESVEVGGYQLPKVFKSFIHSEILVKLSGHGMGDVERGSPKNDQKSNKRREKRKSSCQKDSS